MSTECISKKISEPAIVSDPSCSSSEITICFSSSRGLPTGSGSWPDYDFALRAHICAPLKVSGQIEA